MNTQFLKAIFLVSAISTLCAFTLPNHWFKAGSDPDKYEMGIDKGAGHDGKNAATIESISKRINGFGTLMQVSMPDKYLGKRVRMSGYIKTKDVKKWAGLWLRVDNANSTKSLSFDNMQDRAVKGSTDWKKYEIVLDVPKYASDIAFGALLVGTGKMWFDDIKFEIVDKTVPTTGKGNEHVLPADEPANLDFAE